MQPTRSPSPWSTPPAAHDRWRVLLALGASVATSVALLQVGTSLVDSRGGLTQRPAVADRSLAAVLTPDPPRPGEPQSPTAPAATAAAPTSRPAGP